MEHTLYWPRAIRLLTLLLANSKPIPSIQTCNKPPCPVFRSWIGNSPPSSGPRQVVMILLALLMLLLLLLVLVVAEVVVLEVVLVVLVKVVVVVLQLLA